MNTYKLWEQLTPESLSATKDAFLDAILEINHYNEQREAPDRQMLGLKSNKLGEDGPGFLIIKFVHSVLYQLAEPRKSVLDGEAPVPFDRKSSVPISSILKGMKELSGYSEQQVHALARDCSTIMQNKNLIWKPKPRMREYFLRPWPKGLVGFDQPFAQQTPDWRTEDRIKQEAPKEAETLKVYIDIDSIPLPKADDPKSFVRYVKAIRAAYEKLNHQYTKARAEIDELTIQLNEARESVKNTQWAEAEAEIAMLSETMSNGKASS